MQVKLQVVVFFRKGNCLGLGSHLVRMTHLNVEEMIAPVPTPDCTVPSRPGQQRPRPARVQGRQQIQEQGY